MDGLPEGQFRLSDACTLPDTHPLLTFYGTLLVPMNSIPSQHQSPAVTTIRGTFEDDLLSYSQAALRLGVSRETIYRYQRAGRLPVLRISQKTVRFRARDLDRLVAESETKPSTEGRVL